MPYLTEMITEMPMSAKAAIAIPNNFRASRAKVRRRADKVGFGAKLTVLINCCPCLDTLPSVPPKVCPLNTIYLLGGFDSNSFMEVVCFSRILERAMGIEPTSEAWEASILPLYDARSED